MTLRIELLPLSEEDEQVLGQPEPGGFNDFNPVPTAGPGRPSSLEDSGSLAIWADDELVGSVGHRAVHWGPNAGSKAMMLGIHLLPDARGRGVGKRAMQMQIDMLFSYTTIFRLEAHTDVTNKPTQGLLEGLGFVQEGLIRQAQWRHGSRHDGYLYSLLRTDWEKQSKESK